MNRRKPFLKINCLYLAQQVQQKFENIFLLCVPFETILNLLENSYRKYLLYYAWQKNKIFFSFFKMESFGIFLLTIVLLCLAGEWIQIDLKKATRVVAVVTQGLNYPGTAKYWTTSYKISFGNSTDAMQTIKQNNGSDLVSNCIYRLKVKTFIVHKEYVLNICVQNKL